MGNSMLINQETDYSECSALSELLSELGRKVSLFWALIFIAIIGRS